MADSLTPQQRTERARRAALARWAKEDPGPNARRGQAGLRARFEREVDPEGRLTPAERARRAEAAFQSHMAGLRLRSSRVRAARTSSHDAH